MIKQITHVHNNLFYFSNSRDFNLTIASKIESEEIFFFLRISSAFKNNKIIQFKIFLIKIT
jgi:hypothetical protein